MLLTVYTAENSERYTDAVDLLRLVASARSLCPNDKVIRDLYGLPFVARWETAR
jgi:hypothetical protein